MYVAAEMDYKVGVVICAQPLAHRRLDAYDLQLVLLVLAFCRSPVPRRKAKKTKGQRKSYELYSFD
jgi:hypothetical protein